MPAIWVSRLKIDIIGKLYSSKNKQLMIKSLCSFSDSFMFLGIRSICYSTAIRLILKANDGCFMVFYQWREA